jgi:hypothetical protein
MNLSALPSGPFCAAVFSTWIRPGDSDPWGVMGNGAWFLTGTFLTEAQATSLADLLNAAPGMVAQLAAEKARADKAEAELKALKHSLWHALDDAEERAGGAFITPEHFKALCELIPEEHP